MSGLYPGSLTGVASYNALSRLATGMPLGNTDTDLANRCGAAASFSMSTTLLSMPLPPPLLVRYGTPETSVVQNCTTLWSPVVTELDIY
ncbi:hypothetical protein J6590_096976 [Homalodisca vitripennis]|nr:hypothetical protein J6590_096976 [Homalodisca vitripennis]